MRAILGAMLWGIAAIASQVNFPFESIQLSGDDIGDFAAIGFGNTSSDIPNVDCRSYPGAPDWPSESEWAQLNKTLEGGLLHPTPIAAVCYEGSSQNTTQCNNLVRNAAISRFYVDDPLSVLTAWTEGDTCYAATNTTGLNCTQGGFPEYVVNVTTVKQIQAAVNFARNQNLRLVIKNSGHDWHGRSVGFGSLSVWTHWLKEFEYLAEYTIGNYSGRAARVATGLEAWQMHQHMAENNVTIVVPGSYTIAPYGGWMAAGGHNPLASYYGLGADPVLSLQVVTADGMFLTASKEENQDLFYAPRGGGGSTFGIVTSVIVKALPFVNVTRTSVDFAVRNASDPLEVEKFWRGIDLYYHFGPAIVDAGATAYGDISVSGASVNNSFTFSTQIEMPAMTTQEVFDFVQPLIDDLNAVGISINNSQPVPSTRWSAGNNGLGDTPGNSRFASRLFPRSNFEDEDAFKATVGAIRKTVEAGYRFHGIHMQPTEAVAGLPGNNSVNPAFRTAIMHADLFDNAALRGVTSEQWFSSYQQFNASMSKLRDVTPGSGAYFNEADVEEPNWQQSFFGSNYARLLDIKKARDPWNLFYAPDTVGSESWKVITSDGIPSQNGKLHLNSLILIVPNYDTFILEDVKIFTGDDFINRGYVYVKDGIIEEVKAGSSPDSIRLHAPIRSYSGHSVIPGLIDAHIHALGGNMDSIEQSLRFGVTTVCDMHNNPNDNERLIKLTTDPENDSRYADFKCAGLGALIKGGWPYPIIKKEFSHAGKSESDVAEYTKAWPSLSAPEDAEPFIKEQVQKNKASYIKMFHEVGDTVGMDLPQPNPELQKAVVDAAHQLGVVAVGHAFSYEGAMALLRAGADGLTHIFYDDPPSDDYIALMKETGAHCNPTLGLVAAQTDEGRELYEWYAEDLNAQRLLAGKTAYKAHGLAASQKPKASIEHARANTRALYEAGVPIVAGTDASGTGAGLPYGLGLHMELYALIHHAGLSAVDALKAATSIPADRFKFHDRGRIAKGKKADLALIRTDVVEFLEDSQNRLLPLAAVFRNGTVAEPYERTWNWSSKSSQPFS